MRLIIRKPTTVWGVGIAVALLVCVGLLFAVHSRANAQSGTGGHLITIHDRNEQKVILSDAATIGDALKEANITLDSHDAVEPAADQKVVAAEYQVNIYRARPVTVIDGAVREKIVTAYQTAEQITKDAKITLYPEDTTKIDQSNDFVADGAGLQLTIDRATAFNFTLYGTTSVARTQASTVAEMLKEKDIKIGANDRVSVPLDTPITAGGTVQVWREGKQTITVEEPISFDTQQIKDADQAIGYKAVQTPGANGTQSATYEVDIRDGQEVGRTKIANIVTKAPTTQIEVVGAKMTNTFSGSFAEALGRLRACESGGNYANKKNPKYRGAYQYDYSTWANYGGFYDPADAPAGVQDEKAWETYVRRGWQPWPSCKVSQGLQDIYR